MTPMTPSEREALRQRVNSYPFSEAQVHAMTVALTPLLRVAQAQTDAQPADAEQVQTQEA